MDKKALVEELKRTLGVESTPVVYEVEKGHIKRFAEAIEDPNPLWQNETEARKTHYGSIIAPPTFTRAFAPSNNDSDVIAQNRGLDAGSEWEYLGPVRAGDRITVTSKVVDVYEKEGRLGTMIFLITEITHTNQFGEVVVKERGNSIIY